MRETGHVACMVIGEVIQVLVGKPEWRPLGRPRRIWEENIKCIFMKCDGGMNWIDLTQVRDR